jgi:hypothetical protein
MHGRGRETEAGARWEHRCGRLLLSLRSCLGELHFKNFNFVLTSSTQTGPAPRVLVLKKIETRCPFHEIHEAP